MRAGRLRHRIVLQSLTQGVDSAGGPTETFADLATVLADVEPINGREHFAASQVNTNAEYKITAYWYAGMTSKMRVKFGSRLFDVLSVFNVDEKNREMVMVVKELK